MSLCKDCETMGSGPETHISTQYDTNSFSEVEIPSVQSGPPKDVASILQCSISAFQKLEKKIITLVETELKRFWNIPSHSEYSESGSLNEKEQSSVREGVLKITLSVLRSMNQHGLADTLEKNEQFASCQHILKSNLKNKCQCVFEGIAKQGNPTILNKIYTELYITEGGSGEVNNEHEVRQIETASRRPETPETTIQCNDIFKPLPGQDKPIRTVLTKGVAGIGKTISVQKFVLDWAEGKANQDVHFIFPLPFRELNSVKESKLSLNDILKRFYPETNELVLLSSHKYKIVFIFDGLDECRLPLDFHNNESWSDVTDPASVDVLLTNLIKGNLLPSALLWITTRPAAAYKMPLDCIDQVTEIQGFNDSQKEEYFSKRISDQNLANTIITHIKSTRSLYIMCHIPVFCWISATVLEKILDEAESGQIPKTLTQMYTHFLIFQTKQRNHKYDRSCQINPQWNKDSVMLLGKLAFQQLKKGNLIFYENDLKECGIDITDASVYSGVFTQIFREESGLHKETVYSFVHLSIQEFLAALYVFLMFINDDKNVLCFEESAKTNLKLQFRKNTMPRLLKIAVDKALTSEGGYLDLFLRFLLGLSLQSNQILLRGLLTQRHRKPYNKEDTIKYIKEKFSENLALERSINLFYCLNELNDSSLVEQIQSYLQTGPLSTAELSPAQWSALVFVLLTSDEELDVFDLQKFIRSDEGLLRLLPVVKASRITLLRKCNLTEKSCAVLASVLDSETSSLRELDVSYNQLKDSGVDLLCAGLKNPHCKLESLRLSYCSITENSCSALASALGSNPFHLRELDLSFNKTGDTGVILLSAVLKDPRCKLETLRLSCCSISEDSCAALALALRANPSHLRELDLSENKPGITGVDLLSALLEDPQCKLEKLSVCDCSITEEGCAALASAIRLNPTHLRELDLSWNKTGDIGMKLLSAVLKDPDSKLETLKLQYCSITAEGCASLVSALKSSPSTLKTLFLSGNELGVFGEENLRVLNEDPGCQLETLK
ncbi:NACHT, LRR and PYD domains-containing protein 12-like [Chanos chanos]|uniref:NACHT, LRR and PYD domains-containing protein 12-like n=1 Tax=Chanos chanos TaxID=29144 RepID=A0A6J2WRI0_CHACN|nr:NACHT, LRR and PYD domains-containing protein 12-like [Chanos chanos]